MVSKFPLYLSKADLVLWPEIIIATRSVNIHSCILSENKTGGKDVIRELTCIFLPLEIMPNYVINTILWHFFSYDIKYVFTN
jgi:hypothetical protein